MVNDTICAIVIEPHHCGLLVLHPNMASPHSAVLHTCSAYEIHNLTLFNQTRVAEWITTFMQDHALDNTPTIIVLNGGLLHEELIPGTNIPLINQPDGYIWDRWQIHSDLWYIAGIPYHLRIQYHLLALRTHLNLVRITTVTLAYYETLRSAGLSFPEGSIRSLAEFKTTLTKACGAILPEHEEFPYVRGLCILGQ